MNKETKAKIYKILSKWLISIGLALLIVYDIAFLIFTPRSQFIPYIILGASLTAIGQLVLFLYIKREKP